MSVVTVQVDVRRTRWYPHVGISRYVRSLVEEMQRLAPPDLKLVRLDLEGANASADTTIRVGKRSHLASRFYQEQVTMWRASGRADLLHLPWHEGPIHPRCPLVLTIHDLSTLDRKAPHRFRYRAYYNTLLRAQLQVARQVIVPSLATLEVLEHRWPGMPYVHIPCGVDARFFSDGPVTHTGVPTVLYTGGFESRKRLPDLLEAIKLVAQSEPSVRLDVTGNPPERDLIAMRDPALSGHVQLLGHVSDEKLPGLYRAATVVAYPSEDEGFGFPVLEAFASGTPVVACEAGSIPEVAGNAALLVPPRRPDELGAAILSVIEDAALRERLTSAGRARAGDFSWRTAASQTLNVYRSSLLNA